MSKKYGIFIGRMQPIHEGHCDIIEHITTDGLQAIIFIGSSNVVNDKNPLTYVQRQCILKQLYKNYPEDIVLPLPDNASDALWSKYLMNSLVNIGVDIKDCVLYYHYKEGDKDLRPLLSWLDIKEIACNQPISASIIREQWDTYKVYVPLEVRDYVKCLLEN